MRAMLRLLALLGAFVAPGAALAQDASQDPSSPVYQPPSQPMPAPGPVFGPSPDSICSWGC